MSYIENIYICLAAPILIAVACSRGKSRKMTDFMLAGMTMCLLSSYVSTYLMAVQGINQQTASIEQVPVIEEVMKFLPILFYLLVFEPEKKEVADGVMMTAVGFATFENVCYLTSNGAENIMHLLIRGFGAGAMHVVCGFIIAIGLLSLWDRIWLRVAGTFGLLIVAMSYHSLYNLLVSQTEVPAMIGYLFPLITVIISLIFEDDYIKKIL